MSSLKSNLGGRIASLVIAIPIIILLVVFANCSRSTFPGEPEEKPTKEERVPAEVRAAADRFCERLNYGTAKCEEWFWDTEDNCWEATVSGLSRRAELDINPDGSFSELELVYDYSEIKKILPEVAVSIYAKCRSETNLFIELSLRREEYIDDIPDLKKAWSLSGVVIEFQCPRGQDFEIDARGIYVQKKMDDTSDSKVAEEPSR